MTPAARIRTTQTLLERIACARVPMDGAMGDFFRERRFIGSKDRADIARRTYNIMRARARLNWWMERAGIPAAGENDKGRRMPVLFWMLLGENLSLSRLSELCDGGKYHPAPLNDAEREWLSRADEQALNHSEMPADIRAECPGEHAARLHAVFENRTFEDQMAAFQAPAPLDVRVNLLSGTREAVMAAFEKESISSSPTPWSPWGLRLPPKTFLSQTKPFRKGWIEIQDEGSQMIAMACDARPGMQVLDFCAGAGGKTLALAGAMGNKGRIVAMDENARRLEKARPRFRRAGAHDVIEVRPPSDPRHRKWLRRQKKTFDIVLTDVPCSGSGTWRRNPDLRWRQFGPSLEELCGIQGDILDRVAHTVKPGGRLVYATCSLFREENEDQIDAFLSREAGRDFRVLPLAEAWPEGLPVPCSGPYMRLTPRDHGTDAFFAAVLWRPS